MSRLESRRSAAGFALNTLRTLSAQSSPRERGKIESEKLLNGLPVDVEIITSDLMAKFGSGSVVPARADDPLSLVVAVVWFTRYTCRWNSRPRI